MMHEDMAALAAQLRDLGASTLVADSRQIQAGQTEQAEGQVFVAWPG